MKGIIFTELLTMVEEKMGPEMVETIIDDANLESEGAYTSVGTYPTEEIERLLTQLNKQTKLSRASLLETFGTYLFSSLAANYPHFFPEDLIFFDFLSGIHDYIHVEVKKLYPDAELPELNVMKKTEDKIILHYQSSRRMGDLARGLLKGSMEYFSLNGTIKEEQLDQSGENILFTISKVA